MSLEEYGVLSHTFVRGVSTQQLPVMKLTLQGSEACEYVDKDVDSQEQVLSLVQTPGGEW